MHVYAKATDESGHTAEIAIASHRATEMME
jgi:hypothetical protein